MSSLFCFVPINCFALFSFNWSYYVLFYSILLYLRKWTTIVMITRCTVVGRVVLFEVTFHFHCFVLIDFILFLDYILKIKLKNINISLYLYPLYRILVWVTLTCLSKVTFLPTSSLCLGSLAPRTPWLDMVVVGFTCSEGRLSGGHSVP